MRAIAWGGSLCGALDITAALVTWGVKGVPAMRVLQSVARGLVGAAAFRGAWTTAMLGLALHFLIAFIWASIYWAASRRIPALVQRPIPCGILYGVLVYVMMYWVVVPLSAAPPSRPTLDGTAIAILTHMFCVGLPIAWAAHRFPKE